MAVLGLDLGNTACKAAIYEEDGVCTARAYREYAARHASAAAEMDPEVLWGSMVQCIRALPDRLRAGVEAVAVSSMSDCVIAVDRAGRPLGDAILSYDSRAAAQAREIGDLLGDEAVFRLTGVAPHPMHMAPKCRRLAQVSPEVLAGAAWVMGVEEYILWKPGAPPTVSYSTAGRTMLFALQQKRWVPALLDLAGLRAEQLPTPAPGGVRVGTVTPAAAAETGLEPGTSLVSGGFDQACCAMAAGVFQYGQLLDTTGTNEILYLPVRQEAMDLVYRSRMNVSHHWGDVHATFAQILQAGGAFKWIRGILSGCGAGRLSYDALTAAMPPESTGIFFLPFLSGSGTPDMEPGRRAAFWGVSAEATAQDLAKAVLEGVCYEMAYNLERLTEILGAAPEGICAVGGAAASDTWMQLKADITGRSFTVPRGLDPGTAGAAILAGVGCGLWTAEEGSKRIRRGLEIRTYEPDPESAAAYRRLLADYAALRNRCN